MHTDKYTCTHINHCKHNFICIYTLYMLTAYVSSCVSIGLEYFLYLSYSTKFWQGKTGEFSKLKCQCFTQPDLCS